MNAPPKLLGTYSTPRFDYGDVIRCAPGRRPHRRAVRGADPLTVLSVKVVG